MGDERVNLTVKKKDVKVKFDPDGRNRDPQHRWTRLQKQFLVAFRMKYSNGWDDAARIFNVAFSADLVVHAMTKEKLRNQFHSLVTKTPEKARVLFEELDPNHPLWATILKTASLIRSVCLKEEQTLPTTFDQIVPKSWKTRRTATVQKRRHDESSLDDSDSTATYAGGDISEGDPDSEYRTPRKRVPVTAPLPTPSTGPRRNLNPLFQQSKLDINDSSTSLPSLLFRCHDEQSQGLVDSQNGIVSQRLATGWALPPNTTGGEFDSAIAKHLNREDFGNGSPFVSFSSSLFWVVVLAQRRVVERGTAPRIVLIDPHRDPEQFLPGQTLVKRVVERNQKTWKRYYGGNFEWVTFGKASPGCILGSIPFDSLQTSFSDLLSLHVIATGGPTPTIRKKLPRKPLDQRAAKDLSGFLALLDKNSTTKLSGEHYRDILMQILSHWNFADAQHAAMAEICINFVLGAHDFYTDTMTREGRTQSDSVRGYRSSVSVVCGCTQAKESPSTPRVNAQTSKVTKPSKPSRPSLDDTASVVNPAIKQESDGHSSVRDWLRSRFSWNEDTIRKE